MVQRPRSDVLQPETLCPSSPLTSLQARERWLATRSVWVGMMLFTIDAA